MTKLLEQVIADVRKLSDDEQDQIATELIAFLGARDSDPHLSDEQLAEVRRRRAGPTAQNLDFEEVAERFRNRRA